MTPDGAGQLGGAQAVAAAEDHAGEQGGPSGASGTTLYGLQHPLAVNNGQAGVWAAPHGAAAEVWGAHQQAGGLPQPPAPQQQQQHQQRQQHQHQLQLQQHQHQQQQQQRERLRSLLEERRGLLERLQRQLGATRALQQALGPEGAPEPTAAAVLAGMVVL